MLGNPGKAAGSKVQPIRGPFTGLVETVTSAPHGVMIDNISAKQTLPINTDPATWTLPAKKYFACVLKDTYQSYWAISPLNGMTPQEWIATHGDPFPEHWNNMYGSSGINYDIVTKFISKNPNLSFNSVFDSSVQVDVPGQPPVKQSWC